MVTDISRKLQQTEVSLLGGVPPSAHGDKVCCVKEVSIFFIPCLPLNNGDSFQGRPTKLQEQSWPWIPLPSLLHIVSMQLRSPFRPFTLSLWTQQCSSLKPSHLNLCFSNYFLPAKADSYLRLGTEKFWTRVVFRILDPAQLEERSWLEVWASLLRWVPLKEQTVGVGRGLQ